MSSNVIAKLREYFERFPGIGPRQAQRFIYWLLNEDAIFTKELGELLLELKKETKQCEQCFRFYNSQNCIFCNDLNRDKSRLLVVEKDTDLENIEKAGVYNGYYFVLGDIIPLGQTISKNIRLKELFNRVRQDSEKGLKEIILAFSATAEGDNTNRYLEKILEPLVKKYSLKISSFGRGLSTGTELEYIDRDTLKNALENRK
ncbi:MAG: recombination mediator RecR [Candidatus Tagabacteria bacterium]